MIFSQTHEQVLSRDKTQTRRPLKPGDELRRSEGDVPYIYNTIMKRVRYCAGRDYAVQPGRSEFGLGKIRINDIRIESLLDITADDVEAEGIMAEANGSPIFAYLKGFIQTWGKLYAKTLYAWEHNPEVIVLEFELIE